MIWIILIFLCILVFLTFQKFCNLFILSKVPSPAAPPVIGLALELIGDNQVSLFERFRKYAKQYDGIYRISFMFYNLIQIYNAEDAEQLLVGHDHQTKGYAYGFLESWLGTGLLTSTGAKWRIRRKLLTPTFHFKILQEFIPSFNEETRRFVKKIEENIEECIEDIRPYVISFTMKTICETAMGLDEVDEASVIDYRMKMEKFAEIFTKRLLRVWFRFRFLYNFSKMASEEKIVLRDMHNFTYNVIQNRIRMREGSNVKRKRLAMLDLLLNVKDDTKQIDLSGIRDEVDTFIFEGHDTTSATINFILLLLANYPDIQEKASEEIESIFGGEDRDCTHEDLSKLEYVECCIKETLRLYPSVPIIARKCGQTYTTATGYTIPKGTSVNLHIFDLHRDPKIFPNPEKFDPERFKSDNSTNRPPFSYIPFSAGPRNCIGQKFAMLELKTLICGILKNFKLEAIDTPEDMIFQSAFVLSTVNPIRIRFIKK